MNWLIGSPGAGRRVAGADLIDCYGVTAGGHTLCTGLLARPGETRLTGDLIKLTFPYLLLISLTGFAGAILNSYQRLPTGPHPRAVEPLFDRRGTVACATV